MELNFDEKSCGIVLFREENNKKLFLLLHYPAGHWDLPKGHVEKFDKDEWQTARRELKEETGISEIKFIKDFREPVSYKYNKKGSPSHKQVIFFLAETEEKKVKVSFEHKDFVWLPYEEALKKLTFDNAKELLKKAHLLIY